MSWYGKWAKEPCEELRQALQPSRSAAMGRYSANRHSNALTCFEREEASRRYISRTVEPDTGSPLSRLGKVTASLYQPPEVVNAIR